MADEITIQSSINITKGSFRFVDNGQSVSIDQNGIGGGNPGTVIVGFAAEEVINFGDVTTEGRCRVINLDDTNDVTIGPESGGVMVGAITLKPGEPNDFRLKPGVVWRAQAAVADCAVLFLVFED
jgi:hypothetical protein